MSAEVIPYDFRGDRLDVVHLPGQNDVGVGLRRLCDAVPVDFSSQVKRLARAARRGARWATVVKVTTVAADGKPRETLVIPRRSIPMFAATVSLAKVQERLRPGATEKLSHLHDECAEALADRFIGPRRAPALDDARLVALEAKNTALDTRLAALEQLDPAGVSTSMREYVHKWRGHYCEPPETAYDLLRQFIDTRFENAAQKVFWQDLRALEKKLEAVLAARPLAPPPRPAPLLSELGQMLLELPALDTEASGARANAIYADVARFKAAKGDDVAPMRVRLESAFEQVLMENLVWRELYARRVESLGETIDRAKVAAVVSEVAVTARRARLTRAATRGMS